MTEYTSLDPGFKRCNTAPINIYLLKGKYILDDAGIIFKEKSV